MANPTTNYGFVLPTSSDLVTDLPADFDVALQGVDTRLKALQPGTTLGDLAYSSATANTNTRLPIGTNGQVLGVVAGVPAWTTDASGMTNPMTTTGDTIYSSSGSTPARLGIGTTGQILTVAGGIPSWATPTATAESFASLGSAALTGATTVTVSGLSAKNNLIIIVDQGSSANASSTFRLRFNSDTGSTYNAIRYIFADGGGISRDFDWPSTSYNISANDNNAASNTRAIISVTGAAGTGYKNVEYMSYPSGGTGLQSNWAQGYYTGTSAITSVSLISSTGNFDAGTLYVYGG